MKALYRTVLMAASLATATAAHAAYTTVNLDPYVNSDWSGSTSGSDYPSGTVTIGGVDFLVSSFGSGAGGVTVPGSTSVAIDVGVSMVDTAYVMINSGWGRLGALNGTLTFAGGGNSLVIDLVQGVNIRDHWLNYNQVATDILATVTYPGGNRWDTYAYDISSLGGTLDTVTLTGINGGNPQGQATLTGITLFGSDGTTPAVPETATWFMLILGFGAVGSVLRNRRKHNELQFASML